MNHYYKITIDSGTEDAKEFYVESVSPATTNDISIRELNRAVGKGTGEVALEEITADEFFRQMDSGSHG